jgi:nucleotide-binding universal stress UspA family protein
VPDRQRPKLVVGHDGSDPARRAVRHALAAGPNVDVVVVHAREAPSAHATARWRELLATDEQTARAALDSAVEDDAAGLEGAAWETRLVTGRPADGILSVAREVGADGIVVGSHGYSMVTGALGSVSAELLQRAHVPVTVIPPAAVPTRRA